MRQNVEGARGQGASMRDRRMAEDRKARSAADLTTILLLSGAIALLWRLLG